MKFTQIMLMFLTLVALQTRLQAQSTGLGNRDRSHVIPGNVANLFEACEFRLSSAVAAELNRDMIKYRLFEPEAARKSASRRWPILVWTSGYGEHGDDNMAQLRHLDLVIRDPSKLNKYPFYVMAMQVPSPNMKWIQGRRPLATEPATIMMDILEKLMRERPIDPDQVYLAGVSDGGGVCWELAARYPNRFAAIAPIASAGGDLGISSRYQALKHMPIWAFNSADDAVFPPDGALQTVQLINSFGGRAHLTLVDRVTHNCWDNAFLEHKLMKWLLRQRRGKRCWSPPGIVPGAFLFASLPLLVLVVAGIGIRRELLRQS